MNICILGQYPPQLGGVSSYTKHLKDTLESQGHNVYVLTYKQNCSRSSNIIEVNTINIPVLRGISFILFAYKQLLDIIDKYDIELIHSNYLLPPGFISAIIKRKRNVKIVTTAHGSDINILSKNKLTRPFIKYTLKHVDEVYFVSNELKKIALKLNVKSLNEKSIITPNTVDINKFHSINENEKKLNKKYKKPIVMFIGNLVKQKGLTYLLEAKMKSKTDYTLLIYGDGPEKNNLENMIIKNDIQDVYLLGKTNTPEKIIPESDIMVLPSISEGASIIALESMSCKKAFISTDTGNIKDVITNYENGIIVEPKNSEQLSQTIDELVNDEKLRFKLGENARKLIEKKYSKMNIPYLNKQ